MILVGNIQDVVGDFAQDGFMRKRTTTAVPDFAVPAARVILARNLRALMDLRSWNQVELARRSGVSQTHIGNLLNHRSGAGPEIVDRLAEAFGRKGFELQVDGLHEEILASTGNLSILVSTYVKDPQSRKLLDAALGLLPKKKG